ncbi:MAG: EamA family transporter [Candidatus Pacebacteria bacterium]|nr:EamA family transporter [Candidatus Paceibacterota bacterium]
MWIIYASGSAVAAAAVAIFGKIGLKDIDPTLATIIRGVVMAVILVAAGFLFRKFEGFNPALVGTRAWVFIFLSALAGASSWVLYFMALKIGPASAVAVLDKMSVVLIIIFAAAFLGEALTVRSVLGIILTVAGTLLLLFK